MSHHLMLQAAKRSLAEITKTQSDLACLVAQLDAEHPDYYRVTDSLTSAAEAIDRGFREMNKTAAAYETLLADWRKNGPPPEPSTGAPKFKPVA